MDSKWALLEFRPGRYVKVTAAGEVLGRPTDEEIRTWFASRGWGVDSMSESPSLHLDQPTQPAEVDPPTFTVPQVPETQEPGGVYPTTEVVRDGPEPALAQIPLSGVAPPSYGAEDVPMIIVPETDALAGVVPSEPQQETRVRGADADRSEAAAEPTVSVSPVEVQDNERHREPTTQEAGTVPGFEASLIEAGPPPGEAVAVPIEAGEIVTEPVREAPATQRPPVVLREEEAPASRKAQASEPEMTQSRAADEAVGASAVDGTGRWLWVDPRQEGGYGSVGYDVAAFLGRAVELFESKPWTRGQKPSRLAVHPNHVTDELEAAAEAQGLEIVGDARVMAGTYMLSLADHSAGD